MKTNSRLLNEEKIAEQTITEVRTVNKTGNLFFSNFNQELAIRNLQFSNFREILFPFVFKSHEVFRMRIIRLCLY